jgi:hypothetical protein
LRGGDRLPWIKTGPHEDNFDPLTALRWQAHVYGELRPGVAEACAELGLPLHVFDWQPAMRRSGVISGSLYLVRPDGYIALVAADGDRERLRRYCERCGLAGFTSLAQPAAPSGHR